MKKMYKYALAVADEIQTVQVPKGATPVKWGCQLAQHDMYPNEGLVFWALVDPDEKETEEIKFQIFGTGHDITDEFMEKFWWMETVQMNSGLVWHVFRERPK